MFNLNSYLAKEHGNEHVLEHSLSKKKKFSAPKIYSANGDLSKRWHVYYSYRNPKTGMLERIKNVYGIANRYKKKEDRLAVLSVYRTKLLSLLKEGFNPFEDNNERYQKREEKKNPSNSETISKETKAVSNPEKETESQEPVVLYQAAFKQGLKFKEKLISNTCHVLKYGYRLKLNLR